MNARRLLRPRCSAAMPKTGSARRAKSSFHSPLHICSELSCRRTSFAPFGVLAARPFPVSFRVLPLILGLVQERRNTVKCGDQSTSNLASV
eukprot:6176892-Pleurochrysis_carterae.AAC.2